VKVSIISINFNNGEGLLRTIQSVLNQEFEDFEYIIIDGGSSDNSVSVISEYRDEISYWISEPDKGVFNAQNKGLLQASGEYVLFLNSGDYFHSAESLSFLMRFGDNKDIVYGDIVYKYSNVETVRKYPDKLDFAFFQNDTLPHPCSLIKRELFIKYGLYREEFNICADWAFFLDVISKHLVSYRHVNKEIAVFIIGGLSSSDGSDLIVQKERKDYIIKEYSFFQEGYERLLQSEKKFNELRHSRYLRLISRILPNRLRKIIYE
jgi:glycosyltransferase involved in cell wall biosynthesis